MSDIIQTPLYAWRAYEIRNTVTGRPVLAPVWRQGAPVSLLDWTHADRTPCLYRYLNTNEEVPEEVLQDPTTTIGNLGLGYVTNAWGVCDAIAEDRYGIHAFRTQQQTDAYTSRLLTRSQSTFLTAKIELQGTVVEHEHGYRAEKTRIIELHKDPHTPDPADQLGWPTPIPNKPQPRPRTPSKAHPNTHDETPDAETRGWWRASLRAWGKR